MFEIRVQPTESDLRCAWEARKLWGSIPYGVPSGKASPRTERVFELFSAILFSLKHEGQRLPVECVALRIYVDCPPAFELAHRAAGTAKVRCFSLYRGKTTGFVRLSVRPGGVQR